MRRLLAFFAVILTIVAITGCGDPPIKLPRGTHWVGDRVWVPYGEAHAMASVICRDVSGAEWGFQPWTSVPFRAGELLVCEEGVRER